MMMRSPSRTKRMPSEKPRITLSTPSVYSYGEPSVRVFQNSLPSVSVPMPWITIKSPV